MGYIPPEDHPPESWIDDPLKVAGVAIALVFTIWGVLEWLGPQ